MEETWVSGVPECKVLVLVEWSIWIVWVECKGNMAKTWEERFEVLGT